MAKIVEITEEELLTHRQLQSVVGKIMSNPKAALLVEQARKLVDPNAPTPRIEQDKLLNEPVEAIKKEFEDFKKQQAEEKAEFEKKTRLEALNGTVTAGLAKLRRDGWTDDGIKEIEKLMEEKGILDPEIAAAYHEKMHPPQTPLTPGGSGAWNFMELPTDGDADLKKLIETKGESPGLLDKMARDALNEVRGQSRR